MGRPQNQKTQVSDHFKSHLKWPNTRGCLTISGWTSNPETQGIWPFQVQHPCLGGPVSRHFVAPVQINGRCVVASDAASVVLCGDATRDDATSLVDLRILSILSCFKQQAPQPQNVHITHGASPLVWKDPQSIKICFLKSKT